jgi:uncharacterized protein (DUF2147 family)
MEGRLPLYLLRTLQSVLRVAFACLMLGIASGLNAADLSSPEGLWQPLDSAGRPLGLIKIYQDHGRYFGRIEPSSPDDKDSGTCDRCTDERKGQSIVGLVLIRNMRLQGDEYSGGDILDPDTGRIYGCKFRLTDGGRSMVMRGYFGISLLGRSQTWRRVDSPR